MYHVRSSDPEGHLGTGLLVRLELYPEEQLAASDLWRRHVLLTRIMTMVFGVGGVMLVKNPTHATGSQRG